MKIELPLIFIATLVFCFAIAYLLTRRAGRRKRVTYTQIAERERLEAEVYPHLTEEERGYFWPIEDLRELARIYKDKG